MSYRYHTADVFTETPFGGNQLAVLPDARGLDTQQMARIAREFNYSETIFTFPPDDPSHTRKVRIFTPGSELPFAGHPTIGAAHVLALTGEIPLTGDQTRIVLEEGVGPVHVLIRSVNGTPVFAQLTAAMIPETSDIVYDPSAVAASVSLSVDDLDLDGPYVIEAVSAGLPYLIIPVRSPEALGRARIDMPKWEAALKGTYAPEVYLFTEQEPSKSLNGVHEGDGVIGARMFAPTIGIPEDPATGSAAVCLGGYLARRSARRDGVVRYAVHQGVEMGRPSLLEVEADVANGVVTAVRVGGASVLVTSGELHVF